MTRPQPSGRMRQLDAELRRTAAADESVFSESLHARILAAVDRRPLVVRNSQGPLASPRFVVFGLAASLAFLSAIAWLFNTRPDAERSTVVVTASATDGISNGSDALLSLPVDDLFGGGFALGRLESLGSETLADSYWAALDHDARLMIDLASSPLMPAEAWAD